MYSEYKIGRMHALFDDVLCSKDRLVGSAENFQKRKKSIQTIEEAYNLGCEHFATLLLLCIIEYKIPEIEMHRAVVAADIFRMNWANC